MLLKTVFKHIIINFQDIIIYIKPSDYRMEKERSLKFNHKLDSGPNFRLQFHRSVFQSFIC